MSVAQRDTGDSSPCEMNPSDYEDLQTLTGNTECADCGAPHPDWGSPNLGILFCFQCSGRHRGLGTHISFVRSVTMDRWTDRQLRLMRVGGNRQCNEFLRSHGVAPTALGRSASADAFRNKYDSPAAELYRQVLAARVDGRPEPTDLRPRPVMRAAPNATGGRRKMEGFGSTLPPEDRRKPWTTAEVALGVGAVVVVAACVAGALLH